MSKNYGEPINGEVQDELVIDIKDIIKLFLDNIFFIIFLSVLCFVGTYIYTKAFVPCKYESSVSLYVKNSKPTDTIDSLNSADINAAKSIAGTYISILGEASVTDSVSEELLKKYSAEELVPYFSFTIENGTPVIDTNSMSKCLSYSQINETELVKATVLTGDPLLSADICNCIAKIAPDVLTKVIGTGTVEKVGEPKIPRTPSQPNAKKNSLIGLLGGFVAACGLLLLGYMLNNTITDSNTLAEKYSLAIMGEIPLFDKNGIKKEDEKDVGLFLKAVMSVVAAVRKNKKSDDEKKDIVKITDVENKSDVCEAYSTLSTNIAFTIATGENNAVVFTSPSDNEGKTTTAVNAAVSFSDLDYKVLLIDANLRKPVINEVFSLNNKNGFSTVVSGMCDFESAVCKGIHGKMDVLTSGPLPPNPIKLLQSKETENFINEVRKKYDYVLIDTPTMGTVSDTMLISRSTAGVVVVVKRGSTTFDGIEKMLRSANRTGCEIIGAVCNF